MDAQQTKVEETDMPSDGAGDGPLLERYRQAKENPERKTREAQWLTENASAITAYNDWFEAKGHKYLRHPRF